MLFYKKNFLYFYKKFYFFFYFLFFTIYYKREDLKLKDLNLSLEESRDIIEFLARKRGINQTMNYCMLSKSIKVKITTNNKSILKIKKE